jgi:hypothetical protein
MSFSLQESDHRRDTQFNCFSPPVMLATIITEVCLALYTVWRYKMSHLTRLITLTLVALATFQVAEFFVCTGFGLRGEMWSRIGFVAITTLPPLGIHLMHVLGNKPQRKMVVVAYASMAAFIGFFTFYSQAFTSYQCTGNYVIFQLHTSSGGIYGAYYYGWLLTGLILGARWADQYLKDGKKSLMRLETVRALMVGWLVFLVPTAIANTVNPATRAGIPSVMCGFAVLFALILVLYIVPRVAEVRTATLATRPKARS